ncbi:MAG TPA: hypothetical protein VMZ71_17435, partial [Gemmataceae bacterium]|nr:hypothetical protein [Gemmataceae bacterium]
EDGRPLNQVFITLLQTVRVKDAEEHHGAEEGAGVRDEELDDKKWPKIRCGCMIVIDLDDARVTYVIRKGLRDQERIDRTVAFRKSLAETAPLAATYFGPGNEPFAALHHAGA